MSAQNRYDWRDDYHPCAKCHCLVREHSTAECLAWAANSPGPAAMPLPGRKTLPDLPEPVLRKDVPPVPLYLRKP